MQGFIRVTTLSWTGFVGGLLVGSRCDAWTQARYMQFASILLPQQANGQAVMSKCVACK